MDELKNLRDEIDKTDKEILSAFERRMGICKEIAEYKKKNNIKVFDKERETEVLEGRTKMLENVELKDECLSLFKALMQISKDYQEKLMGE